MTDTSDPNSDEENAPIVYGATNDSESVDQTPKNSDSTNQTQQASKPETAAVKHSKFPPLRFIKWLMRFRPKYIWPRFIRNKLGKAAGVLGALVILILISGVATAGIAFSLHHTAARKEVKVNLAYTPVKYFQVLSTLPVYGDHNVQDDSKVTINFNQPVNAAKLENSFNITPNIKGTIVQGKNNKQIVFTPDISFDDSTNVIIMIDNNFQSQLGQKLTGDYELTFTTQTPDNAVEFSIDNTFYNLLSAQSNASQTLTLNVGSQVDPKGEIVVYQATLTPLLTSFEYTPVTSQGYTYNSTTSSNVDTTGMQQLSSSSGLKDQATINISEPSGIYLVAANSDGTQVGWTWVVFNDNGAVLRQDDQQIILSAFNLSDNSVPADANVSFYNLNGGINLLDQSTLTSPQAYSFPYSQQVDIAVVTVGSDTMIVPIAVPDSLADTRVTEDLSTTRQFYVVTDKPAYQLNDTVNFAGYLNLDEDAAFLADPESSLQLSIIDQDTSSNIQNITVPVTSNGVFSGSFTLGSAFKGLTNIEIVAYTDTTAEQAQSTLASFAINSSQSQDAVKVSFAKSSYLASDTINATITATNASGQPLSNASVTYNVYGSPYYENDLKDNLNSFGTQGAQVGSANQVVQLNSNGQAVVPIDISQLQLPTEGSQVVNVQASVTDSSGLIAGGGASTIVHQGNMIIHFGIGQDYFSANATRFGRVYVTDLNGNPLPNTPISYQFVTYNYDDNTQEQVPTVLSSGSGTTDSNGFLEISQQLNTQDNVTIIATATDSDGNEITAEDGTATNTDNTPVMAGADNLDYLDVSGSSGQVKVGDSVNLTITAPQSMNVLVSYERGRIYKYQMLQLNKGANSYTLNVTNQLAPSFNLVFSYFVDGTYHTEGTAFVVTNQNKQLSVGVTPDQSSYSANQTAKLTITTTDGNGLPQAANLIVAVENDSMFNLNSSFVPEMYPFYYAAREYSTNSTSSLTSIGSGGGGKCGGGGFDNTGLTNNTGTTLYWNPNATTNSSGQTTLNIPMQTGTWHVLVYAMTASAEVGDSQSIITAN